jgi:hypothetical protein
MQQKLYLIAKSDGLREWMPNAFVSKNKNVCVVSDAHVLLEFQLDNLWPDIFIESLPDYETLIPAECLKAMNKSGAVYTCQDDTIHVLVKGVESIFKIKEDKGQFPKYESVIPSEYNYETEYIGINPKMLNDLMLAIDPYAASVDLFFSGLDKPINVRTLPDNNWKYRAIIVPVYKP